MLDVKAMDFSKKIRYIGELIKTDSLVMDDSAFKNENDRYAYVEQFIMMLQDDALKHNDPVGDNEKEMVKNLINNLNKGEKILSIKDFRTLFGAGLLDSKNEIERVYDFHSMKWRVTNWEYNGVKLK